MSLQLASLLLCGLLWGGTNPLIKRGAAVAEEGPGASLTPPRLLALLVGARWARLLSTPQYAAPFLLNLTGSVLFYVLLGGAPLSLVVSHSAGGEPPALLGRALCRPAD